MSAKSKKFTFQTYDFAVNVMQIWTKIYFVDNFGRKIEE